MAGAETLLISGVMAAGAAGASWFSREWIGNGLALIESNIEVELKAMRVRTPHLRKYLAGWLYLMVIVFLLLWFGYGSPVCSSGNRADGAASLVPTATDG